MEKDPRDLCSGKEIPWTKLKKGGVYDVRPPKGKPFRGTYRKLEQSSDFNSKFWFAAEQNGGNVSVPVSSQFFLPTTPP